MEIQRSKSVVLGFLFVILFTTIVPAHEGGKHFRGTVKSVDADSLTILTITKETVVLKLLPTTKFVNSMQPGSVQDLKTGQRVVVHAKQNGDSWEAQEVEFGKSAPAKE